MIPEFIDTWQMTEPGKLRKTKVPMPVLESGDVVVQIKGCGVCHTDLSYFYMGVPTVQPPPLSLGHEISGVVIAGEAGMIGKEVIIPAVFPATSASCARPGAATAAWRRRCPATRWASTAAFPATSGTGGRPVRRRQSRQGRAAGAPVGDRRCGDHALPGRATRATCKAGDRVIVIGAAGGVGSFMTQVAKGMGAGAVIGIDINEEKLEFMKGYGADFTINPRRARRPRK
jgi:6-hydroxycyclohex-1-ene-1-carbonyl-CoA dehydrogenase